VRFKLFVQKLIRGATAQINPISRTGIPPSFFHKAYVSHTIIKMQENMGAATYNCSRSRKNSDAQHYSVIKRIIAALMVR
jgi:hypothetical protein